MNTRGKGIRKMLELEDFMIAKGTWCKEFSYKAPHGRFLHDIFMMFDGIAVDMQTKHLILWQLKSNRTGYYSAKKDILRFKNIIGMWNESIDPILYLIEKKKKEKSLRIYSAIHDGHDIVGHEKVIPMKIQPYNGIGD
jgi:hypothetical protein